MVKWFVDFRNRIYPRLCGVEYGAEDDPSAMKRRFSNKFGIIGFAFTLFGWISILVFLMGKVDFFVGLFFLLIGFVVPMFGLKKGEVIFLPVIAMANAAMAFTVSLVFYYSFYSQEAARNFIDALIN